MKVTFTTSTSTWTPSTVTLNLQSENCQEATLLALIARHGYKVDGMWAAEAAGMNEPASTNLTLNLGIPVPPQEIEAK